MVDSLDEEYVVHTELRGPVTFRRWSGSPHGEGHGPRQARLWVRDADQQRVGFVLDGKHLYLLAGWEPVRAQVVDQVRASGAEILAPSIVQLAQWDVRASLTLWPGRDQVDIYDEDPEEGHVHAGIYWPARDVLDVWRPHDRGQIARLLRRAGMIGADQRPAPYAGTVDRPRMSEWANTITVVPVPVPPAPTLPEPISMADPEWSASCTFPAVHEFVPPLLRERVLARLRLAHQQDHGREGHARWRASGRPSGSPDGPVDRAYWDARGEHTPGTLTKRHRAAAQSWTWPADLDSWVDELIDVHAGFFAVVAAHRCRTRYPHLWDGASALVASNSSNWGRSWGWFGGLDRQEAQVAWALAAAIWDRTRQRRTWDVPDAVTCPVCSERFDPRTRDMQYVLRWGAQRWCGSCTSAMWSAQSVTYFAQSYFADDHAAGHRWALEPGTDGELDEAARFVCDVDGVLTAPPKLRSTPAVADRVGVEADRWLLARIAAPDLPELAGVSTRDRWLNLLRRAGVVGAVVRLSRGVSVIAADGHPCRSLLELAIDDFLHRHGIAHVIEPMYPFHPQLNASGARRGDWLLPGRVVVEAAGLNDPQYVAKIADKAALAELVGFRLITVGPDELEDLPFLLADVLTGESRELVDMPAAV